MSDTVDATLTPAEAARAVAQASRWEDSLIQRTEGLTAMIWGLVTPAIFVTYNLASLLDPPDWAYLFWWLPWAIAGNLATFALWRSAALTSPHLEGEQSWLRSLIAASAVGLAFLLAFIVLTPTQDAIGLVVVGAGWLILGFVNPFHQSRRGCRVMGFSGAAILASGLILAALTPAAGVGLIVAIATTGILPLTGGLWQTIQG